MGLRPTMQFKGVFYTVAQTTDAAYKWTVRLAGRELNGVARNWTLARLSGHRQGSAADKSRHSKGERARD
jgi:hypothetical protein